MAKIYHLTTGNYLPITKRFFQTMEECSAHFQKIASMKKPWITQENVEKSHMLTIIDTDLLPEYEKIFRVFDGIMENDVPEPRKNKKIDENDVSKPKDEKTVSDIESHV